MKEDYKITAETKSLTVNIEAELVETLKKMSVYSKFSEAEIVNTAVKRFVAVHSDFLPKKS